MRGILLGLCAMCLAESAAATDAKGAVAADFRFPSIDGGDLNMSDWTGRPVLVANTASMCGFTGQYDGLQALYDRYRDRGLVVLAVPSDDFNQEYADASEVKEFCEVNFDLDMPMTDILHVKGPDAHPFYQWVRETSGFVPRWNFNKVLIGPEGAIVASYGATTRPTSRAVTAKIEALLPG